MSEYPRARFDVLARITELREMKGLSVYKLAKLTGIPQSTIASWYQKYYYPPIDKLELICHALGVTLSEFFRTKKEPAEADREELDLLSSWRKMDLGEREALAAVVGQFMRRH